MKDFLCDANNGYRIAVKGSADFAIKVDGKKFNEKKDYINAGEHTVEVSNRIYLIEWYGIFLALLDYIICLFAGDVGDIFVKQGYIKYNLLMQGNISGDVYIEIVKDALPQFISGDMRIVQYSAQPYKNLEKLLKKYRLICRIISAVFLFAVIAALAAAIIISNI